MSEKDDDLTAGFGAAPEVLSDEDSSLRQEQFNKRVKKQIAIMMSPKKFKNGQRADAARLLGEYGEPTSIPYLVKTAQNDNDSRVKAAARQSLGMLKALGSALDDPDTEVQAFAREMIGNVILKNQLGKAASPSISTRRRITFVLLLVALVVGGIAAILPPKVEDLTLVSLEVQLTRTAAVITPSVTPTSSDPNVLLGQFRDQFTALDNNSRTLQTQMLVITRQQTQDCSLVFEPNSAYITPDALNAIADFPTAVTAYNSAQTALAAVQARFTQSCQTNTAIERTESLTLSQQVVDAQRELGTVSGILTSIGIDVPATATLLNVPTNTPAPTETPIPTATLDAALVGAPIANMENILDEMEGQRGKNTLLLTYWQNVQQGSTGDCLQMPPPAIPNDVFISVDALALIPALQEVANTLNAGLIVTRNSWLAFNSGCDTRTLGDLVGAQIPNVQQAAANYASARTQLDAIQQQIGQ